MDKDWFMRLGDIGIGMVMIGFGLIIFSLGLSAFAIAAWWTFNLWVGNVTFT